MFKTILVPLDGSAVSEQALPAAISLARHSGARLHLVQVVSVQEEKERAYMEGVSERVSDELGESVDFCLCEEKTADPLFPPSNAEIASALRRYGEAHGIDLVVMSTHGRGALRRAWLGSVADTVIRGSRLPVLLVRPGAGEDAIRRAFRHIAVPLDRTESAARVVDHILDLARVEKAAVTLIRIIPPPVLVDAPYWVATVEDSVDAMRDVARRELGPLVDRLRAAGVESDAVVEIGPEPSSAILDYVSEHGVDLIAMTSRGRSKWERLLLGSVAERVIHHARVPVLLFPPVLAAAANVEPVEEATAISI